MALDGIYLYALARQIGQEALNSRVEKIHQPSKEEIIIWLRSPAGRYRLLCCANPSAPRVQLTNLNPETPKIPPQFCTLLRKHLSTGKLVGVRQEGLDRVLHLDFEAINELGDVVTLTLTMEIMGRHSNLILVNQDGKVLDAIRRVGEEQSSVRLLLPGVTYRPAPAQHKLNPFAASPEEGKAAFSALPDMAFSKAILQVYQGISPLLSRELAEYACNGAELNKSQVSDYRYQRLFDRLAELKSQIDSGLAAYTMVLENGRPREFSVCPLEQYRNALESRQFSDPSSLLDGFYSQRDLQLRMAQKGQDLLRVLTSASQRAQRKLDHRQQELQRSLDRQRYQQLGDLIQANLYQIKKGDTQTTVTDYFDPEQKPVTISLDPALSPAQNAQKYYKEYRKAKTARELLGGLIQQNQEEIVYLDTIFDELARASRESDLNAIREELEQQGYLRKVRRKLKPDKPLPPMEFVTEDGFTVLCGRNNKQNDQLTLKTARNYDVWFHTKDIPGSHVILQSQGEDRPIPERSILQAATIAATHSRGQDSNQVPVDYTLIKYVKKPNGAQPGMVIFTHNKTLYVAPNPALCEKLAKETN